MIPFITDSVLAVLFTDNTEKYLGLHPVHGHRVHPVRRPVLQHRPRGEVRDRVRDGAGEEVRHQVNIFGRVLNIF